MCAIRLALAIWKPTFGGNVCSYVYVYDRQSAWLRALIKQGDCACAACVAV